MSDSVVIVGSADDLPAAVRHANRNRGARLYVAQRAYELGEFERIPQQWGLTAASVVRRAIGALRNIGWDASLHPRGRDGRFIKKLGSVDLYDAPGAAKPTLRGKSVGLKRGADGKSVVSVEVTKDGTFKGKQYKAGDVIETDASSIAEAKAPKATLPEGTAVAEEDRSSFSAKKIAALDDDALKSALEMTDDVDLANNPDLAAIRQGLEAEASNRGIDYTPADFEAPVTDDLRVDERDPDSTVLQPGDEGYQDEDSYTELSDAEVAGSEWKSANEEALVELLGEDAYLELPDDVGDLEQALIDTDVDFGSGDRLDQMVEDLRRATLPAPEGPGETVEEIAERDAAPYRAALRAELEGWTDEDLQRLADNGLFPEENRRIARDILSDRGGDGGPGPDADDVDMSAYQTPGLDSEWRPGDADPADDPAYARAVLSEAASYQESNLEDGDQDDRLDAIMNNLKNQLEGGGAVRDAADELREYLITEGYADDEDLPSPPAGDGGGPPADGIDGPPEDWEGAEDPVDFATDALEQFGEGAAEFSDFWSDDPADREAYEALLRDLETAGRADLAKALNEYDTDIEELGDDPEGSLEDDPDYQADVAGDPDFQLADEAMPLAMEEEGFPDSDQAAAGMHLSVASEAMDDGRTDLGYLRMEIEADPMLSGSDTPFVLRPVTSVGKGDVGHFATHAEAQAARYGREKGKAAWDALGDAVRARGVRPDQATSDALWTSVKDDVLLNGTPVGRAVDNAMEAYFPEGSQIGDAPSGDLTEDADFPVDEDGFELSEREAGPYYSDEAYIEGFDPGEHGPDFEALKAALAVDYDGDPAVDPDFFAEVAEAQDYFDLAEAGESFHYHNAAQTLRNMERAADNPALGELLGRMADAVDRRNGEMTDVGISQSFEETPTPAADGPAAALGVDQATYDRSSPYHRFLIAKNNTTSTSPSRSDEEALALLDDETLQGLADTGFDPAPKAQAELDRRRGDEAGPDIPEPGPEDSFVLGQTPEETLENQAEADASADRSEAQRQAAERLLLMVQSANKESVSITPSEANTRLNEDVLNADTPEEAHKAMARLMTDLKLGGKQRKRYREFLDQYLGDEDGESENTMAAEVAANLSDDNPLKARLAEKAGGSPADDAFVTGPITRTFSDAYGAGYEISGVDFYPDGEGGWIDGGGTPGVRPDIARRLDERLAQDRQREEEFQIRSSEESARIGVEEAAGSEGPAGDGWLTVTEPDAEFPMWEKALPDGKTAQIKKNGENSYTWSRVNPDGTYYDGARVTSLEIAESVFDREDREKAKIADGTEQLENSGWTVGSSGGRRTWTSDDGGYRVTTNGGKFTLARRGPDGRFKRLRNFDQVQDVLRHVSENPAPDSTPSTGGDRADLAPSAAPSPSLAPAPQPGAVVYRHPQGAVIYVNPDGSMEAYGKDGRKKKTSATPEKLAAGHGQWKRDEREPASREITRDSGDPAGRTRPETAPTPKRASSDEVRKSMAEFEAQMAENDADAGGMSGWSIYSRPGGAVELVDTRRSSVERDLAEGEDTVWMKVPSESEVTMPAGVARVILEALDRYGSADRAYRALMGGKA